MSSRDNPSGGNESGPTATLTKELEYLERMFGNQNQAQASLTKWTKISK